MTDPGLPTRFREGLRDPYFVSSEGSSRRRLLPIVMDIVLKAFLIAIAVTNQRRWTGRPAYPIGVGSR